MQAWPYLVDGLHDKAGDLLCRQRLLARRFSRRVLENGLEKVHGCGAFEKLLIERGGHGREGFEREGRGKGQLVVRQSLGENPFHHLHTRKSREGRYLGMDWDR